MADDWERLLDDFDQAIGQSAPPAKSSTKPSLPPGATAPQKTPTFAISTERRPSTDDLLKLVASAPPKTPLPAPPTPQAPPQTPPPVQPLLAPAPPLLTPAPPQTAALLAPAEARPEEVQQGGRRFSGERVLNEEKLASLVSEIFTREISELSEDVRVLSREVATVETRMRSEISGSEGRVGEAVRLALEDATRNLGDFVAREVGLLREEQQRRWAEEEKAAAAAAERQPVRDLSGDLARLAKEKETVAEYKAELSGLLRASDARMEKTSELVQEAKQEMRRQLEMAEDERRRAAMELEQATRLRREVEAERRTVAAERQAVEEQARRVAEKAQEISEAWRKAGEAREEVMQLCAEVEREKETLVREGERLDELRDWVDAEKEQLFRRKTLPAASAQQQQQRVTLAASEMNTSAEAKADEKWSKLRQDAEHFHKMVSSLSLPPSMRASMLANN